ncbi:MAG TPA: hypothetical protein VID30_15640 [Bradyrhizobium sp.]|jgi:hypothetical protein
MVEVVAPLHFLPHDRVTAHDSGGFGERKSAGMAILMGVVGVSTVVVATVVLFTTMFIAASISSARKSRPSPLMAESNQISPPP